VAIGRARGNRYCARTRRSQRRQLDIRGMDPDLFVAGVHRRRGKAPCWTISLPDGPRASWPPS
jgi:hypothetical protein